MEVLQRTANRGSIATGAASYEIENSLKLESDNAEYLYYTPSTQTDYQRMAFSVWLKRTELSTSQRIAEFGNGTSNTSNLRIGFDTSDRLFCYGNSIIFRQTNQVFRDISAWYHLFFQFDTTQSTANDRIKIWVNGSMIAHTDFGVINNPGSGAAMGFNNALQQSIGAQREDGPVGYFNGYMAQVYGSGGTPPSVTDFGEFDEDTGIWKPIDISALTPPDTQGFNLDFSDSSNLGNDISSRNNNFTLQNITAADQATDTPTNNFCTMNPLLQNPSVITPMTEGATFITGYSSSTVWQSRFGTVPVTNGKWYTELKADGANYTNNIFVGYCGTEYTNNHYSSHLVFNGAEGALAVYSYNGDIYGGTGVHGVRIYDGDVVAMMLDADNGAMYFKRLAGPNSDVSEGTITWSRDGTNTADPTSGASKTGAQIVDWDGATVVAVSVANNVGGIEMNFGGYNIISNTQSYTDENGYGSFVMQPPTGYYALCSKNLALYG